MYTTNEKNFATLIHLSTLTQYCIPFGNYIFPILIWSAKKDDSEFVDYNGKQVLNFQLSILLYSLVLLAVCIPLTLYTILKDMPLDNFECDRYFIREHFLHGNMPVIALIGIIAGGLFIILKFIEILIIINAAVKAMNGERYRYPLSIPFFK
jgi:uncharacterized Tic20 family protein